MHLRLPDFTADGVLPEGGFELTLDEIRESMLVKGPGPDYPQWDANWRKHLVDNLEILVRELWTVGVTEIFIDGSFLEDKDHPNDIDGYFECNLRDLVSGNLQDRLNQLDPHRVWSWDPAERRPPTAATRRSSCPCGISTAWSSIRILPT